MSSIASSTKLSSFQCDALELLVKLCNVNGIGEFHSIFGIALEWPSIDYGSTIKINLPNHEATLWLYQESFHIFENERDEYGCADELIDCNDDVDRFMELFVDKSIVAFNFKNRPA